MRGPRYFLLFSFSVSILFSTISAYAIQCSDGRSVDTGCQCNHTCNAGGSSSHHSSSTSSGDNNAATSQMIQQGTEMLIQLLDDSNKERQAREDKEQFQLQQEEMLEEQEKQRQLDKARQDSSLNPWKDGPSFQRGKSALSIQSDSLPKVGPKDPNQNYDGKSCEYFIRPSDEAHLSYHSDGTVLSYGNNVYKCVDRRWKFLTTREKYWAPVDRLDASWLEGGSQQ